MNLCIPSIWPSWLPRVGAHWTCFGQVRAMKAKPTPAWKGWEPPLTRTLEVHVQSQSWASRYLPKDARLLETGEGQLFCVGCRSAVGLCPCGLTLNARDSLLCMLGTRLLPPEDWDYLAPVVKALLNLLNSLPSTLRVKDLSLGVKPQKLEGFSRSAFTGSSGW